VSAVVDANDDRFSINSCSSIQRKGEGNLFGLPERYHGTEREAMLREVSHHPSIGGREFDIDEAQRAFSKLRPAVGLQTHRSNN
jgi:hypothetical protein